MRYGGATGQLTVRADSGFYAHALVAVCRAMEVRYSITIRQHARLRNIIEAIPEEDWTPIPYWMDGAADVAIDRVVHHSVILEFDVPSYRTNAAQQRVQAKEVNWQN